MSSRVLSQPFRTVRGQVEQLAHPVGSNADAGRTQSDSGALEVTREPSRATLLSNSTPLPVNNPSAESTEGPGRFILAEQVTPPPGAFISSSL